MSKIAACIGTAFLSLTLAASHLQAASITLQNLKTIPTPFSGSFYPAFILNLTLNDSGDIAGTLLNSTVNQGPTGFVLSAAGVPTAVELPASFNTFVTGINNSGTAVGYGLLSSTFQDEGFTFSGGTFTQITSTGELNGINNHGDIIGRQINAFLIHAGVTTTITVPGFSSIGLSGINDSDQVVGTATDNNGSQVNFLRQSNGTINLLDFIPVAINDAGVIVGDDTKGFGSIIDINGAEYTFSIAGTSYAIIEGINNNGEVIGEYGQGFNNYIFEGQLPPLTSTPEPATNAAVGIALLFGMLMHRRLKRSLS